MLWLVFVRNEESYGSVDNFNGVSRTHQRAISANIAFAVVDRKLPILLLNGFKSTGIFTCATGNTLVRDANATKGNFCAASRITSARAASNLPDSPLSRRTAGGRSGILQPAPGKIADNARGAFRDDSVAS